MQQMLPQQPIPLHVLAEIQRAMAHASVVAKQTGGVPCNPNDIFMQGANPHHVSLLHHAAARSGQQHAGHASLPCRRNAYKEREAEGSVVLQWRQPRRSSRAMPTSSR